MDRIFLTMLNMSITATYITTVVLVLRLLLKRTPKGLMVNGLLSISKITRK